MLERLYSIEDVGRRAQSYVDCYVSTDTFELREILNRQGYRSVDPATDRKTIYDLYLTDGCTDLFGCTLVDQNINLEIDCADIPLCEALGRKHDFQFVPMSKLRLVTKGRNSVERICLPIFNALRAELQNIALVDDIGSSFYLTLSDHYWSGMRRDPQSLSDNP